MVFIYALHGLGSARRFQFLVSIPSDTFAYTSHSEENKSQNGHKVVLFWVESSFQGGALDSEAS